MASLVPREALVDQQEPERTRPAAETAQQQELQGRERAATQLRRQEEAYRRAPAWATRTNCERGDLLSKVVSKIEDFTSNFVSTMNRCTARSASLSNAAARRVAIMAAIGFALSLALSCGTTAIAKPQVCIDLGAATDISGIGSAIDNVAPGHDYAANELKAESMVRESCPDQEFKLERYREQVLNPVFGGN